jgi:hypothetical protein
MIRVDGILKHTQFRKKANSDLVVKRRFTAFALDPPFTVIYRLSKQWVDYVEANGSYLEKTFRPNINTHSSHSNQTIHICTSLSLLYFYVILFFFFNLYVYLFLFFTFLIKQLQVLYSSFSLICLCFQNGTTLNLTPTNKTIYTHIN